MSFGAERTNASIKFLVTEQTQVGQVRREAIRLAQNSEFTESHLGKIALLATELATLTVDHKGADVEEPRDWHLREVNLCNDLVRNRLNVSTGITVPHHHSVREDKILSPLT